MKRIYLFVFSCLCFSFFTLGQEYADFEFTGSNQGTGTFVHAALSNFNWTASGTINGQVEILNSETFDDGSMFESTFGQADNAENIRTQIYPNGTGTIGTPILSTSKLTIDFDQVTPIAGWGFCVIDIDVENCLISAIDDNDNPVSTTVIDTWLLELFDADIVTDGVNLPKWDPTNAALLGTNTPTGYTVYNNIVIGGLSDSEAAGAFFMPNIPLKSLMIDFENLQDLSYVSYHFYIGSESTASVSELENQTFTLQPNPANSKIIIDSPLLSQQDVIITIYDTNGRKILRKDISKALSSVELDISNLQSGIYLCKLATSSTQLTKKFIIK